MSCPKLPSPGYDLRSLCVEYVALAEEEPPPVEPPSGGVLQQRRFPTDANQEKDYGVYCTIPPQDSC
jgi:hypothetical protein